MIDDQNILQIDGGSDFSSCGSFECHGKVKPLLKGIPNKDIKVTEITCLQRTLSKVLK